MGKRKSNKPGWIDWVNSDARTMLLKDLIDGVLPIEVTELLAEDAWNEIYSSTFEFAEVCFPQFKACLSDHRKQIGKKHIKTAAEFQAFTHDRILFPQQLKNKRGELVFDLHPAKQLLCADVLAGKHKQMTPGELQRTQLAYMQFEKTIFKLRVHQEVRRSKFINWLEKRRAAGNFE
jgi:hypothetical protein